MIRVPVVCSNPIQHIDTLSPYLIPIRRRIQYSPSSSPVLGVLDVTHPIYILALLTLLFPPGPLLLLARLVCLSSRRVTQIQNQLMTSTNAKAKKTLFLSPSPPQVLAAYPGGGWVMRARVEAESPKMGLEGEKRKE